MSVTQDRRDAQLRVMLELGEARGRAAYLLANLSYLISESAVNFR
jgi:hypothetical protein